MLVESWVRRLFDFFYEYIRKRIVRVKKNPRHLIAAVAVTIFLFVVHEATAGSVGVAWVVAVVEGLHEIGEA